MKPKKQRSRKSIASASEERKGGSGRGPAGRVEGSGGGEPSSRQSPLSIALASLSFRDRSCGEILTILERKGIDREAAEKTVARLAADGLLNDARFAQSWGEARTARMLLGRRRIVGELLKKGVAASVAESAASAIYGEHPEEDLAIKAFEKFRRVNRIEGTRADRRAIDYLLRRGFSWEIIRKVIRSGGGDDDR